MTPRSKTMLATLATSNTMQKKSSPDRFDDGVDETSLT